MSFTSTVNARLQPARALAFIGVESALGAPFSCGPRGPAAAPDVLRALGLLAATRRSGLCATWAASLLPENSSPGAFAQLLGELADAVAEQIEAKQLPVILGGDHSIAAGTWRGVGRALGKAPGLLWIDAHLDAHTPATTPTGNRHGMPVAALLGVGEGAMTQIDGPTLDPMRIAMIGIRSYEADEMALLASRGVRIFGMDEIRRRGLAAVFADALQIVGAPYGLSLDVDALDPLAAPGVSTPAADGIAPASLRQVLTGLLRDPDCVAFEIAEYNPERDPQHATGQLICDLLEVATQPDTATLADWEFAHGANNYAPLPVMLTHGQGCWLTDRAGKRYLDLMSAYSAVSFGHAHPRLVAALSDQARRLAVTSRAYSNDRLPVFLKRLTELTSYDRALPVNTGLEAVETALKAARKWGHKIKGIPEGRAEIIACAGNFHGRSIAITGLSTEAQYRDGFGPFPPGLKTVPYGDAAALEAAITPHTAAFLVEPIQGEGGIIVPPPGYLAACAEICRRHHVLLIADEVQTGLGRTGYLLACQHEGIRPDGVILGKALGGGLLPVSAFLADENVMQVFTPGDHGSTFGGNALAAAVALAALDLLIDDDLIAHSATLGAYLLERLNDLQGQYPLIAAVRGRGLFAGIELAAGGANAATLAHALLHAGVLTKDTHSTVLRLAPPLVITRQELDWGLQTIADVFARHAATQAV